MTQMKYYLIPVLLFIFSTPAAADRSKSYVGNFNRGVSALQRNDYKTAIKYFRKATEIDPDDVTGWNALGSAFRLDGRLNASVRAYRKSLEIKPDQVNILVQTGYVLLSQEKHEEALKEFRSAAAMEPDFARGQLGLALAASMKDLTKEASRAINRAVELAENEFEEAGKGKDSDRKKQSLEFLIYAYRSQGAITRSAADYDVSIKAYNNLLELVPEDHGAYDELGKTYLAAGMPNRAITPIRKAIALSPKNADYFCDLANAYMQTREFDKAILNLRKSISLNPDSYYPYYALGETYRVLRKYEKAIEQFRKALAVNSRHAGSYRQIGKIQYVQGHLENARKVLEFALVLDSRDEMILELLGDVSCDLGDYDNSTSYYTRASVLTKSAQIREKLDAVKKLSKMRNASGLKYVKIAKQMESFTRLKGKNFAFQYNTAPEVAECSLDLAEKINSHYHKHFGVPEAEQVPCTVVLLNTREQYQRWCTEHTPKLKENSGYYDSGKRRIVVYKSRGPLASELRSVLAHELLHFFVRTKFKTDFNTWLHEGLATYYQLSTFEESKPVFGGKDGERLAEAADLVRTGKAPSVERIFILKDDAFHGPRHGDIYSLSYSLVYFLMKTRHTAFITYLKRLQREDMSEHDHVTEFMTKEFGSVKKFEKMWRNYLLKNW